MQDEPKFMRIRTKKHELIITPGKTLSIIMSRCYLDMLIKIQMISMCLLCCRIPDSKKDVCRNSI